MDKEESNKKESSPAEAWAENEVKLACKHDNPDWDGNLSDPRCACYQSALKAYKSLLSDEHTGLSFEYTKNFLIRLMNDLPLTPITEADFDEAKPWFKSLNHDDEEVTCCPRLYTLYRTKKKDGTVIYSDFDRGILYKLDDSEFGLVTGDLDDIISRFYPIELPYMPPEGKFKVYMNSFTTTEENSEGEIIHVDVEGILYMITPDNNMVKINLFRKSAPVGGWIEISKEEYDRLNNGLIVARAEVSTKKNDKK